MLATSLAVPYGNQFPVGGINNPQPGFGLYLYVSSTYGKDSNEGSVNHPLASIRQAVALVDGGSYLTQDYIPVTIVCLQGHVESMTSTLTLNVPNLTIMSASNSEELAPTFNWGTSTTATILVTGVNTTIIGMKFTTQVNLTTVGFIDPQAQNLSILNCIIFLSGNTATPYAFRFIHPNSFTPQQLAGLTIDSCKIFGDSTNINEVVIIRAANDTINFNNNQVTLLSNRGNAILASSNAAATLTNLFVTNNVLTRNTSSTSNKYVSLLAAGNTGMIAYNSMANKNNLISNQRLSLVAPGVGEIENYGTGENDKSGILVPVADTVTPAELPGLLYWWDASDPAGTGTSPADNTAITTWVDKASGNNFTLTTGNSPVYRNNTGVGRINFTGASSQYLDALSNIDLSAGSLLIVFKPNSTITTASTAQVMLGHSTATTRGFLVLGAFSGSLTNETLTMEGNTSGQMDIALQSTSITSTAQHQCYIDSTNLMYYDRALISPQVINGGWASKNWGLISRVGGSTSGGGTPGSFFTGDIYQIIFTSAPLDSFYLTSIMQYFSNTYATP